MLRKLSYICLKRKRMVMNMEQRIIDSRNLKQETALAISECEHDRIFVLSDENTARHCWPSLKSFYCLKDATLITTPAGDANKSLDAVVKVWQELEKGGATRHSCLINLGGGMVTDLGGFAASTFKRGMDFINMPTTLLAMVDAAIGGKTGFNFGGLKNEIGVFSNARFVILNTGFLKTLDESNLRAGYAEMLKHGLIDNDRTWAELVNFDLAKPDLKLLQTMLTKSVRVKQRIVKKDPREHDLRKALNLGHTIGHAIEEWSMEQVPGRQPLLHGYAVAYGLMGELYLSAVKAQFPADKLRQTVSFIRNYYGTPALTCDDYPRLLELMTHDKKNINGLINFTLLSNVGDLRINCTAMEEEIKAALDFVREG